MTEVNEKEVGVDKDRAKEDKDNKDKDKYEDDKDEEDKEGDDNKVNDANVCHVQYTALMYLLKQTWISQINSFLTLWGLA